MKLSPQKEKIVSVLRDQQWHCGRDWVNQVKDDRIRITELNRGYMKEKGYTIIGSPCKGRMCGKSYCPLFMRKAVPLTSPAPQQTPDTSESLQARNNHILDFFETYQPNTV